MNKSKRRGVGLWRVCCPSPLPLYGTVSYPESRITQNASPSGSTITREGSICVIEITQPTCRRSCAPSSRTLTTTGFSQGYSGLLNHSTDAYPGCPGTFKNRTMRPYTDRRPTTQVKTDPQNGFCPHSAARKWIPKMYAILCPVMAKLSTRTPSKRRQASSSFVGTHVTSPKTYVFI